LQDAMEWLVSYFSPEEIFEESELADWALNNGYVLEDEQ